MRRGAHSGARTVTALVLRVMHERAPDCSLSQYLSITDRNDPKSRMPALQHGFGGASQHPKDERLDLPEAEARHLGRLPLAMAAKGVVKAKRAEASSRAGAPASSQLPNAVTVCTPLHSGGGPCSHRPNSSKD